MILFSYLTKEIRVRGYYTHQFRTYWHLRAGVLLRSYLCYMGALISSLGLLLVAMHTLNTFGVIGDESMKFVWKDGYDYCTFLALLSGFGYFVRKYDQIGWVYRMKQRHRSEMDRVKLMEDLSRMENKSQRR